ncbi:MAG: Formylglycine-generating [Chloroflexi bacterium]|jgi:ergothioneine biosynthesis protein EgtB|nr:MAG: Formylglycine-generating [Chloroflexota bacterium]
MEVAVSTSPADGPYRSAAALLSQYQDVRRATEHLCQPLAIEDYILQAMADVSPTRWHLAHVSWFFETFLLKPHLPGYESPHPKYEFLFNSYYNAVGPQYYRPHRGLISRPTVAEVYDYRAHVDQGMVSLLEVSDENKLRELEPTLILGLNHEQQHQELIITDIKYNLAINPLRPAYHNRPIPRGTATPPLRWMDFQGGIHRIGYEGTEFAFDNEGPRHEALLRPFRIASRLVTNGEFMEFMAAGGYGIPTLWLSDGWTTVKAEGWDAPLYWEKVDGTWWVQTMSGMQPVDEHAPVAHVSYYEADAYAHWKGKRLPTEQEWERSAETEPLQGTFMESGVYHPLPAPGNGGLEQLYGDVWEWTQSPYSAYPGFKPTPGAVGEYNGKFMVNQMVLRGGSCATPRSHLRTTYRNFFPPHARWQFMGFRLAEDA